MNPFDFTKSMSEFWSAQSQAFMAAQQQAVRATMDGMQAMASGKLPEAPVDLGAGLAELTRAGQAMMELWSAALSMASGFANLPAEGDATAAATLRKMMDPRSWMAGPGEMDDVLGRMAEGPRFADLWEVERRYARVAQAWMDLRRRGFEHNAVVLQAWMQAGQRFSEAWNGRTGADAQDSRAALALWTETANRQLLETQRSEAFLQTQAAMIRATTELRFAQQEMVEHFGKQYGFPTRTELDDVHRTVTELRRELRAMRREQQNAPAAVAAERPAAVPVPRRNNRQKSGTR